MKNNLLKKSKIFNISPSSEMWAKIAFISALALVLFLVSCRIKKDVTKTKETTETSIHATETSTTVSIETGTLITKADSTEAEFVAGELPVTVVTNLPGIVTETTFDPLTKTVKTKTVQKPQEIPVTKTSTTTSNKTSDTKIKQKKQEKEKHKETSWPLWFLIIPLLAIAFIMWRMRR